MSKMKELKIRESLKAVYSLYSEVNDFIFTTFNYEPDFFAEYIVAYLMGFDRKISTIGELQAADEWVRKNNLSVYYDKGALETGSNCLTIPNYPQNNKTGGVFHPKVIVIYGKLKKSLYKESVHMFVSSCNLTVCGYGRNVEDFACIQVTSIKVAQSLKNFLNTLDSAGKKKHSALVEYLDKRITRRDDSVEFLWQNEKQGDNLLDVLSEFPCGNLTVLSPYYDENGPKALLEKLRNRKKTTIIPAIEGENYNIHKKDFIDLKNNQNVGFSVLENDDNTRFVHAKLIHFGNKLIIGSYNFTTAAMCGMNAEAALLFNDRSDVKLNLLDVNEEAFMPDNEAVSDRDGSGNSNKAIFVSVMVLWKENKICISSEDLDKDSVYTLRLDGLTENLIPRLEEYNERQISHEITNCILRHKSFSVFRGGIICFKGLINEFDTVECRPEFGCESLSESIREWFNYSEDSEKNDKRSLRLINTDDEETENVLGVGAQETEDIFDNYYSVAKAFEQLIKQILTSREGSREKKPKAQRKYDEWKNKKEGADNNLYGYLVTKPGSIEEILSFLKKENEEGKNKDVIYEWLIVNYVKTALSLFPTELIYNDINKIYKEKKDILAEELKKIEDKVSEKINLVVDKKYLKWIESEFKKRG